MIRRLFGWSDSLLGGGAFIGGILVLQSGTPKATAIGGLTMVVGACLLAIGMSRW